MNNQDNKDSENSAKQLKEAQEQAIRILESEAEGQKKQIKEKLEKREQRRLIEKNLENRKIVELEEQTKKMIIILKSDEEGKKKQIEEKLEKRKQRRLLAKQDKNLEKKLLATIKEQKELIKQLETEVFIRSMKDSIKKLITILKNSNVVLEKVIESSALYSTKIQEQIAINLGLEQEKRISIYKTKLHNIINIITENIAKLQSIENDIIEKPLVQIEVQQFTESINILENAKEALELMRPNWVELKENITIWFLGKPKITKEKKSEIQNIIENIEEGQNIKNVIIANIKKFKDKTIQNSSQEFNEKLLDVTQKTYSGNTKLKEGKGITQR